jgi:hypothetical protein
MAKHYFLLVFCAFLSVSCTSVRFGPEVPRGIPEDLFGMAHAGHRLSPKEYRLLDELGVVWMRRTLRWNQTQRRSKDWDFRRWDSYIDKGKGAGKKILGVLAYDVGWIYGEKEARRHVIPEKIPYFLQYVEGMVRRYKGKIDAFEIWNEPNWVFWKGPDEDFVKLSKAAAEKIKEIDPSIKVVAGSFWRVPESFIRKMFEGGAMDKVDAVSFHPYAIDPRGVLKLYDRFKKLLEKYNFKGEIWVTEVGYPTGGWYATGVSEEKFPDYVIKTLAGLAVRGARVIFWYELFDKFPQGKAPSALDSELFFGLAYRDYHPKAAAAAYSLFARNAAGSEYRPDLIDRHGMPPRLEALYFLKEGGRSSLVLWNEGAGSVSLELELPGADWLRHDITTGEGTRINGKLEINVTDTPFFITFQSSVPQNRVKIAQRLGPGD